MNFFRNLFKKPSSSRLTLLWEKNLRGMDDVPALEYATSQLNSDNKNDLFHDEQAISSLLAVSEKTQLIAEKVAVHYVGVEHVNSEVEEHIEYVVFLYYRQMFIIYNEMVSRLAQSNHTLLPVVLAIAMRSAIKMLKWRYYSYQPAPANVWLQLSNLYKVAEQKKLLNNSIEIFSNHEPVRIATTYIQACMLGTLESLSLKRKQIEMVCRILERWNSNISIEKTYDDKKHLFYVDTVINAPAKRIRNFTPTDTCLYWCMDEFNFNVELSIAHFESHKVHHHLVVKEFSHNKYALKTLEILHAEWSRLDYRRQRRSEDRHKELISVTTAYGFDDVCYQLKQCEGLQSKSLASNQVADVSKDVTKDDMAPNIIYMDLGAGSSNVVDESKRGLGLHVNKHVSEVNLDMMVCVLFNDENYRCRVGQIRSIKPISIDELHLMIEVLSDSAVCVQAQNMNIKKTDSKEVDSQLNLNMDINTPFTCVFLPKVDGLTDQETLLLPRFQYNSYDPFKVKLMGEDKVLKFTDIVDQQDDWVRVAFEYSLPHLK